MRFLFFPAISLLLALASCTGAGHGSSDHIDTLDLKGEIIIPYDSLAQPERIYATDSNLYILNSMNVDTLIEEYTLDGKFVRSFLTKGNGPDEVSFIYYATLDPYRKQLDIIKTPYTLDGLDLDGTPALSRIFTVEVPEGTDTSSPDASQPMPGGAMVRLADGSVLAGNMSRGGFLAQYAPDGSFSGFYAPYPSTSEYGDGLPDYMVFNFMSPQISVSPDGRHFAARMGVADYLVFGELSGDSLKVVGSCVAPPKGIKVEVGNGWSSFEYEDSYVIPVKYGPIMSADRAYVVRNDIPENEYMGIAKKMTEGEIPAEAILTEYDFNGNQVGAIRIDALPRTFAVTPDGSAFYVLTETADDGIVVKRYIL